MDPNLVNLAISTAGSLIANAITWTADKIRNVATTGLFRRATPDERPALLTAVEQALQQSDTDQARNDLTDVLRDYLQRHEEAAEDFRSFLREYPVTAGQTTITNQSGTKIGQQGTFNGGTFSNTM